MITLTARAEQVLKVLHALDRRELLMVEAAQLLGRSVRQIRRLRTALRATGPTALVHGNRGHPPVNRIADSIRARVVRLATKIYIGVNDHHLQELLSEREGLTLSRPSVRRILRAAGRPSPRRRRPPRHRRRRERMPQAGLLIQLDGSTHAWLDQRGPRLTLIAAMDDATGEVLAATFRDEEDAHGYFQILHTLTQTKGIPIAAYSDRHGIFHRSKTKQSLPLRAQLAGEPASTQIARALHELRIQWIPAKSPQAKGRIERLFGTFQDRLRAELRLAGVVDRKGANAFLRGFLSRYNARFARRPVNPASAYRPWPAGLDPQTIFCFKYQRTVNNDHTVGLGGQQIQLLPASHERNYAKAAVEVHERLDGSIAIFYQGRRIACRWVTSTLRTDQVRAYLRPLIPHHPHDAFQVPASQNRAAIRSRGTHREVSSKRGVSERRQPKRLPWSPPPDHPWRCPWPETKSTEANGERTKSLNP